RSVRVDGTQTYRVAGGGKNAGQPFELSGAGTGSGVNYLAFDGRYLGGEWQDSTNLTVRLPVQGVAVPVIQVTHTTVAVLPSWGKLRQLTFAFNSRGLSAGYQRDIYSDGQHGHTYKLGLATGQGGFAAGLTAALYRGAGSGTGWDVGLRYDVTEGLIVGAAIQNIGGPHVRDSTLRVTYVPGATLLLGHQRVGLSALSQLTSDGA